MISASDIDALLPQTQCTRCGYTGCMPYAEAIARGDADGAARLIDHHGRRASENLLARLADVLDPPTRKGHS